jgi:outer membrane autotransporter protein
MKNQTTRNLGNGAGRSLKSTRFWSTNLPPAASRPGQLSTLTLALAGALSALTALTAAQAQAQTAITVSQGSYTWSSADLSVASGVTVAASGQGTGIKTGGNVGTLTNLGSISGWYGIYNLAGNTIASINNTIGGTIIGTYVALQNSGSIGILNNSGSIGGLYSVGIASAGDIGTLINSGIISAIRNYNGATIGTLGNSGTINGGISAIMNQSSIGTLMNSGTISTHSTWGNVILNSGSIGTLSNSGNIISGSTQTGNSSDAAIYNSGDIGILSNTGSITISIAGRNAVIYNTGHIGTLANGGLINGVVGVSNNTGNTIDVLSNSVAGSINGIVGILNFGTITALTNNGIISAKDAMQANGTLASASNAIVNYGNIATLTNTGSITSTGSGSAIGNRVTTSVPSVGTIGLLSNSGVISGAIGVFNSGQITALDNRGTISARSTGLSVAGAIGVLNNSGLITGSLYAIALGSAGSIGSIVNSGTVAGAIVNRSSSLLNINGGSGAVFGTLTGLNGSIGNLYSAGNVVFSGGNQLLNDNIGLGASPTNNGGYSSSGIGTVTNAGAILQINNHITITGSYVQDAAATLASGISSGAVTNGVSADTGYGRLVVTGNAVIAAGSTIMLKPLGSYSYAAGQRYVVLQAAGAQTDYNAAALNYKVTGYTATGTQVQDSDNSSYSDLVVTLTGLAVGTATNGNTSAATNGNASVVLNKLFNYSGTNQDLLNVFNSAIALTDPTTANRVGAKLNPAATANALAHVSGTAFGAVQDMAGAHMDGQRTAQADGTGSGVATGESRLAPAAWGRLFGGQANQAERDGISGYHSSYGGFLLGSDVQLRSDWRVGGLFSYAHSNIGNDGDNSGNSGSVNAYGLTAYAGYDGHPWYVNLTAGLARQLSRSNRSISYSGFDGIANGSFVGNLFTTTADAGIPLAMGDATLTPLAGLRYSTLRQDGYTETGGSGAALTVNGASNSSLKSELGARYARSLTTGYGELQPFMQLSWNHEFRDTPLTTSASFAADTTGSTAFTTQGVSPLRDTASLSLGATLLRSKNLTLTARYTLEGAAGYSAQTADMTLRWQY